MARRVRLTAARGAWLRSAVALALVIAFPALTGFGESAPSKNREGNRLYKDGKYDEAPAQYRAAQVLAPEILGLSFNAGDALFRKGDVQGSLREFGKAAAAPDSLLSANAHYNAGNTLLQAGQAQQAIAAYTEALKRNPGDEDAKFNLELALQLLQQQQQQQDQQNQQNQQNQDQRQDQQKSGEDQQEKQDQQKQDQEQESEEQQQADQEQSQAEQQEAGMSKQDAERLLDAVGEQEREIQAELREAQARKRTKVDKDW